MDPEVRHSKTIQESLAVVFSCEQFTSEVYELQFSVVTDHKSFSKWHSLSCSELSTHWYLRLQETEFKLEFQCCCYLIQKSFFVTPNLNKADHFDNYVISSSVPKTLKFHEIREVT